MIRPFKTSNTIHHGNVMYGLLTPAASIPPIGGKPSVVDERHYLLAICDWCGTREIIDDPVVAVDDDLQRNDKQIGALREGLNWVTDQFKDHDFCSGKCRYRFGKRR